jgi:hypothetical protein
MADGCEVLEDTLDRLLKYDPLVCVRTASTGIHHSDTLSLETNNSNIPRIELLSEHLY